MSSTTNAVEVVKTYLELISQDEKSVKIEQLKIEAQRASISVQTDIMELNSAIATKKIELSRLKRCVPYSVRAEYEVSLQITDLEDKLEFCQNIKSERFSDVSI
jgi:cell division protein FtsL